MKTNGETMPKIWLIKNIINPCQASHSPSIPSISPMSMLWITTVQDKNQKGKKKVSEVMIKSQQLIYGNGINKLFCTH